MEVKRQRKRIDYARLSRSGLEAATTDDPEASLPCSSCKRNFYVVHVFLLHITHCSKETHVCPICCEERLKPDKDGDKGDLPDAPTTYPCAVELDKHVTESHLDSFPFQCWICQLKYSTLSSLQKHQVVDHKVVPTTLYEKRDATVSCSACDGMFETTDELAKHFNSNSACQGNLMLWQCADPQQDSENDDIIIRLRECLKIESEFVNRFPRSRIGLGCLMGVDSGKSKSPESRAALASSPKKERKLKPKPSSFNAKVALKSQAGRGRPPLLKATGPPKVKFVAKKPTKKRESTGDSSKKKESAADKSKKRTSTGDASRKQGKAGVLSKMAKESASDASKKRQHPLVQASSKGITETDPIVANVSPKRRRVAESPAREELLGPAEDELDDVMSSPEVPFVAGHGGSPGLEPEDDEDEEEAPAPALPLSQVKALSMTCDLDEEEEDSRAAPAVEMNVCRACGLALDSFAEYTSHMQVVHDLNLQSPPINRGRGRSPTGRPVGRPPGRSVRPVGRPPKNPIHKLGAENGDTLSAMRNAEFDQVLHQVNWTADAMTIASPKTGKKRGRKPKVKEEEGIGGAGAPLMPSWMPGNPRALLCPVCPDRPSFSSSDAREAHLAADHDGERAFGCQACGETFSLFYELQLHTRQEHDMGNGPPPLIEDPARAKLAYKCVVCKVGFQDEVVLQRHYDAMHTLDEGEQYHCPVCYFTYSGCRTRDDHVIKKHPDARAFKCPVCEARFASFEVFRAHEKRAHISQKTRMRSGMGIGPDNTHSLLGLPEKPKKTPRRKLAAAMRGALAEKNSDSVEALAEKRRKSHVYKEGTLYCEKCNEDCANEEELDIHTKEHVRKEKRFGCTQCGRVFSGALARSFLVDHIKLEHMHQPAYVCDDCGQRFLYKVQSDRHRTVDRDSGVASCKRPEELNIPLPRLVFGCSRCAKIFAGGGAQSRYSEHQLECVGAPPAPAPPRAPRDPTATANSGRKDAPGKMSGSVNAPMPRPVKEAHEVALAISEAVGEIDQPVDAAVDQSSVDVDAEPQVAFSGAEEPADSGLMDAEPETDVQAPAEAVAEEGQQRTVIVLPGSDVAPQTDEGDQVVMLPEDVLSNVRAGLGDDVAGGGSVVLIQAEDGTLIVASEEHLAELQMQEAQDPGLLQEQVKAEDEEAALTSG